MNPLNTLSIADHPLLDAAVFLTELPRPLGELPSPAWLLALLAGDADAPIRSDDTVKRTVRDLLRHGGFKPTGRNKPASEYLLKAVAQGRLGPDKGINLVVDACNVASYHSGLPISVVDADLAAAPWRIAVCEPDTRYVFNPAGQVIDIGGLVSLQDADGPCGGPVKDSQRTKTHDGTVRTLSVVWGTRALEGRTAATAAWYRELLEGAGAHTRDLSGAD